MRAAAPPIMRPVEIVAARARRAASSACCCSASPRAMSSRCRSSGSTRSPRSRFLWLAMLGSAIAIDRNEHLRLTLFVGMMPQRLREFVADASRCSLVAAFLLAMIYPAIDYAIEESFVTSAALNIPNSWRVSAIAVGIVADAAAGAAPCGQDRAPVGSRCWPPRSIVGRRPARFWLLTPTLQGPRLRQHPDLPDRRRRALPRRGRSDRLLLRPRHALLPRLLDQRADRRDDRPHG